MLTLFPDSLKTLAIALGSSFFTVCLIEPIKNIIQRRIQKRELRRALYQEMVNNYQALLGQVTLARHDAEMKSGIGIRFAMKFKRFCFDLAQRDPVTYYGLGFSELYWIELRYADMEHIIKGTFDDEEQRFRSADSAAYLFLANLKDRNLNRRLIFRVSPLFLRQHFHERLPNISYTDMVPPGPLERMRRKFDDC